MKDAEDGLTAYDVGKTYDWNYDNPPSPCQLVIPQGNANFDLFGRRIDFPVGVSAGPLLNGRWILYYASLGFDVLTYKTVRSCQRSCYPEPNLLPVDCEQLTGNEKSVHASNRMKGSWAVSFGMPSKDPTIWRKDVELTRQRLASSKLLAVSVVGTVQEGWTIDELADDYAKCAKWAVESGADCVEANYSCPNVSTCDGQLYQQPDDARIVSERIREAIKDIPFVIKIGHFLDPRQAAALVKSQNNFVDAIATTNSIATTVQGDSDEMLFNGDPRGICGTGTRQASVTQTRLLRSIIVENGFTVDLIGVGGIGNAADVMEYLQAGATSVQIATAAMINPRVAIEMRADPLLQQYMSGHRS